VIRVLRTLTISELPCLVNCAGGGLRPRLRGPRAGLPLADLRAGSLARREPGWAASSAFRDAGWATRPGGSDGELAHLAALLRDIFGNPFHAVAAGPACLAWHGGAPIKLAQAIYDDRRLP
jgi:hypothetical protein